jgi:hypothetical protein
MNQKKGGVSNKTYLTPVNKLSYYKFQINSHII